MTPAPMTEQAILLGRTQHADWPSLVEAVLGHVQQAAHESGMVWVRARSKRRVRLELVPGIAALPTIAQQTRQVAQALGAQLDNEWAVRGFSIVMGTDAQQHHLVLIGF